MGHPLSEWRREGGGGDADLQETKTRDPEPESGHFLWGGRGIFWPLEKKVEEGGEEVEEEKLSCLKNRRKARQGIRPRPLPS